MKRVAGFSLVELMVTVVVMAVLAAAGTPFARAWMDSNRQMQARNLMWEAVSQARALALRNPGETVAGEVAARLVRTDDALVVQVAGSSDTVWNGTLPRSVATKLANQDNGVIGDLSCIAFDNRGNRVVAGADCAVAATVQRIAIGLGSQEALHVDLL